MSRTLARLRMDLDFMPSPVEDRPGLLIRDSFQYSDATLIIPPSLVPAVQCFDGEQTDLDLRRVLVEVTGDLQVGELEQHLEQTLSAAGFLEDENYEALKEAKHKEFADAPVRFPAHAGSAYPAETDPLRETLGEWLGNAGQTATGSLLGVAAPHVSPEGGVDSYRAAYNALRNGADADRTFIILGTSHYGQPDRFGLTRKAYRTPFGDTRVDLGLIDELAAAAPDAVTMEDYCHAVEHSVEFQVTFLQFLFGPAVKVVPILCGSFAKSIYVGGKPEENPAVEKFLGTLGEISAREGSKLCWVLGVDMAHMGRRYGDEFSAEAGRGEMARIEQLDRDRISRMEAGDPQGFWERIQENRDRLRWCGSSPIYTFMKAHPEARGTLKHYEQWNIDPQSVVSFAGITFAK